MAITNAVWHYIRLADITCTQVDKILLPYWTMKLHHLPQTWHGELDTGSMITTACRRACQNMRARTTTS